MKEPTNESTTLDEIVIIPDLNGPRVSTTSEDIVIIEDVKEPMNSTTPEDVASKFEGYENNPLRGNATNVRMRRPTGSSTTSGENDENIVANSFKPSPSIPRVTRSKGGNFGETTILGLINLFIEIVSAVIDQFVSPRMPISLVMSFLPAAISVLYLIYKIKAHKLRFQWKWSVPWFYYPTGGYKKIFGNLSDMVLLVCGVVRLIVSAINYSFILLRGEDLIKMSVWPLFYAICMVFSKFMEKIDTKPTEKIDTMSLEESETKSTVKNDTDQQDDETEHQDQQDDETDQPHDNTDQCDDRRTNSMIGTNPV